MPRTRCATSPSTTASFIKSGWAGEHTFKTGFGWMRNPWNRADWVQLRRQLHVPDEHAFRPEQPTQLSVAAPACHGAGGLRRRLSRWRVRFGQVGGEPESHAEHWRSVRLAGRRAGDQGCIRPTVRVCLQHRWHRSQRHPRRVGKVYQYQQLAVPALLARGTVIAPTLTYDTAQVASPAATGLLPTGSTAEATACLRPLLAARPVSR